VKTIPLVSNEDATFANAVEVALADKPLFLFVSVRIVPSLEKPALDILVGVPQILQAEETAKAIILKLVEVLFNGYFPAEGQASDRFEANVVVRQGRAGQAPKERPSVPEQGHAH